jgi:hypothetical protein
MRSMSSHDNLIQLETFHIFVQSARRRRHQVHAVAFSAGVSTVPLFSFAS